MTHSSLPEISLLVIGYGNIRSTDYSAGYQVAEILKGKNLKYIHALSVHQLSSRLASVIIRAKLVIFISSYSLNQDRDAEIMIKHFPPHYDQPDIGIAYPNPPHSLLSLVGDIYGSKPDAYWILIPAVNHERHQGLSFVTCKGIQDTIEYLTGECCHFSFRRKDCQKSKNCHKTAIQTQLI